jgi:hypothetical protein
LLKSGSQSGWIAKIGIAKITNWDASNRTIASGRGVAASPPRITIWHITIVIGQQCLPQTSTFLDCHPCNPTHFLIVLLTMSSSVLSPLDVSYDKRFGMSITTLTSPSSLKPIEDIMAIETSSVNAIVLNDYSKIFSSLLTESKGAM